MSDYNTYFYLKSVYIIYIMDNKKLLGKRIKEIRKSFGYTQEQLSELIEIETSSLSGIESGRFFPSLHVLDKMCTVLNIPMIEFFKFIEIPTSENFIEDTTKLLENLDRKNQELIYKIIKAGFSTI